MQDARPSRTAARVALRRASHQLLDRPLVFEDPLALRIIRPDAADQLRKNPSQFERGFRARYLRAFLAVRSRIAEDVIGEAIGRGVRQVVVLGAGLDTFACRNARDDVRVFEVDHPATQGWKRARLRDADIAVPPTATFVPVDFERHALRTALLDAGLDSATPTIFSWLGVTPYLEDAAVWATLGDVAFFAGKGGGVVFDYSIPPTSVGFVQRFFFRQLASRVAKAGEPFRTYFDPPELHRRLTSMGFTTITDLGAREINARCFAGRRDGLKVGGMGRVAVVLG